MKKSLNLIAAAALLGTTAMAPLAFAQNAAPAPADPANPAIQTPNATGVAPSTDTMSTDTKTSAAATTNDTYLTEQSATQVSANEFIGTAVYTSADGDESIGEINDLIVEQDGRVAAAIVGVGGFLGVGEKDVAVPMSKITVTHEEDGNGVRLTTTETAELLKAAPAFKTLEEQADAAQDSTMAPDTTTTSSTDN